MKIYIEIEIPDNFENSLSMRPIIEQEIKADRWSWHLAIPQTTEQKDNKVIVKKLLETALEKL